VAVMIAATVSEVKIASHVWTFNERGVFLATISELG